MDSIKRPLDKVQTGIVTRCASQRVRNKESVLKNESINCVSVSIQGVDNDYHRFFKVESNLDKNVAIFKWAGFAKEKDNFLKMVADGYVPVIRGNISLTDNLTYNIVGQLPDGSLGENLTIEGIDLNVLRVNSFIQIGNEVVLQVKARRSICLRGFKSKLRVNAVLKKPNSNVGDAHVGILCLAVRAGTIKTGDKVVTIPCKNKIGLPWQAIPDSTLIKERVEYLSQFELGQYLNYNVYKE